ncbi:MAG TPA: CBS domain-containing protein [Candidatus Saccharimonadales bacterium]|jgi:CBS domain containing-hemolysin-like protein
MDTHVWLIILDAFLWAGALLLSSLRIPRTGLSQFELRRRVKAGVVGADVMDDKERLRPRIEALFQIKLMVLIVLATGASIGAYGWWLGLGAASALVMLALLLRHFKPLTRFAGMLYGRIAPRYEALVANWHWLDRFAEAKPAAYRLASTDELHHLIEGSGHVLPDTLKPRLLATLELPHVSVRDVSIPIARVHTVGVDDGLGPLVIDSLHRTGHDCFPVIDGDVDHIVGLLDLASVIDLRSAKGSVREAMGGRVGYVHEFDPLERALAGFAQLGTRLLVVVDNTEATVGIVTLDDALDKAFGGLPTSETPFDDRRAAVRR